LILFVEVSGQANYNADVKSISEAQVRNALASENSWWVDGEVPKFFGDFTHRPYLDLYLELMEKAGSSRAIILLGPRRVGKTVMIHHAVSRLIAKGVDPHKIFYCSTDKPIYNGLGLTELLSHFEAATGSNARTENCYIFFDEIQYLRDWEIHIKSLMDGHGASHICASGSAAAALRLKSHESGAGRFTDFMLPPLTFYEYLELLGNGNLVDRVQNKTTRRFQFSTSDIHALNTQFINYINFGGYPEIALTPEFQQEPGRFIKNDIIDKVLLRDLPSLYGIQDIQELNHLFTALAFNSGNEVSLEGLAQNSGVAKNTIKRYIEYLEAAFLLKTVSRVDNRAKRFKRQTFFKVYLTNPSIRTALFDQIDSDDEEMGDMVETAYFAQWFHDFQPGLHYARWSGGEVDMVRLDGSQSINWAVEIKWSDAYFKNPGKLKSLLTFCRSNGLQQASITTISKEGWKAVQGVDIEFIPASLRTYIVGFNIIKGKIAD